ncbi:MAG: WG repeat-containing protein [Muribaculum sp.]|nr:WG repeat-containing protein [Muribaculum sp.]
METKSRLKDLLNTEVPFQYVGLPLLDIVFKPVANVELKERFPDLLLTFRDSNYCIVSTADCGFIDLDKCIFDETPLKIYTSTFCKVYYAHSYANMDVIGTILREYLECKNIHACTYPGEEYWRDIDFYVGGIPGYQIIGRVFIDVQKGYDYFIYNCFDNNVQFIDLTEDQFMKLIYLQMGEYGLKSTMIEQNGIVGLMTKDDLVFPSEGNWDFVSDNDENHSYNMVAISQNDRWGFVDTSGKVIVSPHYEYAKNGARHFELEHENIACARVWLNEKVGLVDSYGNQFVECIYDSIGDDRSGLVFRNGMALVCKNQKYGFINRTGQLIIDCIYDLVDTLVFSESDTQFNDAGIAILELNGKIVFIDKSGKIVKTSSRGLEKSGENYLIFNETYELINDAAITELKFEKGIDYLYPFEGKVARVRIGKKWGLINQHGEWLTPLVFDRIYRINNNLARVKINEKYGIIDITGQWMVSPEFDSIQIYSKYIGASLNSNSVYFDLEGGKISKPILDLQHNTLEFHDGLAKDELNGKWGFKDASNQWVIHPQYEEVSDFHHGWSSATSNGIIKYIDKSGESLLREGLSRARSVSEDTYWKCGFIDNSGNWVIMPIYENVGYFYEGLAKSKFNGKWGFIDRYGEWVIEAKYEDVGNFRNGIASVIYNDECHWINSTGVIIK